MAFYIVADTSRLSCEGSLVKPKHIASQFALARANARGRFTGKFRPPLLCSTGTPELDNRLGCLAPMAIGYATLRQVVG